MSKLHTHSRSTGIDLFAAHVGYKMLNRRPSQLGDIGTWILMYQAVPTIAIMAGGEMKMVETHEYIDHVAWLCSAA